MKTLVRILMVGLVIAAVSGIFSSSAQAGVWLADVAVTPAPCVTAVRVPVMCAPVVVAVPVAYTNAVVAVRLDPVFRTGSATGPVLPVRVENPLTTSTFLPQGKPTGSWTSA